VQVHLAFVGSQGTEYVVLHGHNVLGRLSWVPRPVVDPVVERHADLYRRLPDGTPAVRIENGRIAIGSVLDAPFGLAVPFDPTRFTPLKDWTFESLSDQ
jgi:hypothetical protein